MTLMKREMAVENLRINPFKELEDKCDLVDTTLLICALEGILLKITTCCRDGYFLNLYNYFDKVRANLCLASQIHTNLTGNQVSLVTLEFLFFSFAVMVVLILILYTS